jgi:hypothetical protein
MSWINWSSIANGSKVTYPHRINFCFNCHIVPYCCPLRYKNFSNYAIN